VKSLPFAPDAQPAIIAPVVGSSVDALARLAKAASENPDVDVIEWRIDAFLTRYATGEVVQDADRPATADETLARDLTEAELPSRESLANAYEPLAETGLPVLITVRTVDEGGRISFVEESENIDDTTVYERVVSQLIDLGPAAIDIELDKIGAEKLVDRARAQEVFSVVSQHDWLATPPVTQMTSRLQEMAGIGADVAKIAVTPRTPDDTLDLLAAVNAANENVQIPIIGIAMGTIGRASRVLGHDFGSAATFGVLDQASAPGQLRVSKLRQIFDALAAIEHGGTEV
jgi:3-dehydroquinate dehydratase-1